MEPADEDEQLELTDEDKKFIRGRAERAEKMARKLFAKVDRIAGRAGEEAEAKATIWARRKGFSEEDIEAIGGRRHREAQLLMRIRQALRENVEDAYVMDRADDFYCEEAFIEKEVEKAGQEAAAEIGFDEDEWWQCGYFEKDDEDDESA